MVRQMLTYGKRDTSLTSTRARGLAKGEAPRKLGEANGISNHLKERRTNDYARNTSRMTPSPLSATARRATARASTSATTA